MLSLPDDFSTCTPCHFYPRYNNQASVESCRYWSPAHTSGAPGRWCGHAAHHESAHPLFPPESGNDRSRGRLTIENAVGTNAGAQQFLVQFPEGRDVIVNPFKQYRLVPHIDAAIQQLVNSFFCCFGDLYRISVSPLVLLINISACETKVKESGGMKKTCSVGSWQD